MRKLIALALVSAAVPGAAHAEWFTFTAKGFGSYYSSYYNFIDEDPIVQYGSTRFFISFTVDTASTSIYGSNGFGGTPEWSEVSGGATPGHLSFNSYQNSYGGQSNTGFNATFSPKINPSGYPPIGRYTATGSAQVQNYSKYSGSTIYGTINQLIVTEGIGPGGYGGTAFQVFSVPEPGTWGMMILGFGLVGGTMRRRRSRLVLAA